MVLIFFSRRGTVAEYTVISPATVTIADTVRIGAGAVIYPNNHIFGNTTIGAGAVLLPNNIIEDSVIGEGARIEASVLRGARVGKGASIGPFSNLRAGAVIGENCRVGDFVEIKNASLGTGSKVSHLTYVGDADLGADCNVGCGVVFCNYDGAQKKRSKVGSGCFIGSNANIIAPVTLGDGCYIAAGTTVARDVPAGAFVIGRARQQENAGLSEKYGYILLKKRAKGEKKDG